MNCYDFDKTIYRKDCSIKFYFYCLLRTPLMFFHLFQVMFYLILNKIGFINTKKFKEKFFSFLKNIKNVEKLVEQFWNKQIKHINKWYLQIKQENDVICSASPSFLVKPIMLRVNQTAKVICTEIDIITGTIHGENLKGVTKVTTLKKTFGNDVKFDAVYTDSLSDFPMLDLTDNKYIVCGKKVYKFGKQKPTFLTKIKYILKQLRVKHYIKNGLIFLPLFFSSSLTNLNLLTKTVLGFFAFSLIASFVYVFNDLIDVKNDRQHTTKRKRPIASFMIKIPEAVFLLIITLISSLCIGYFGFGGNYYVLIILLGYVILNITYSLILKNLPILDAFVLASCYLVRVFFGGFIIDVPVSKWLYLTILCASLYMGFGKRRNEITKQNNTRRVNAYYDYNFLDKNLYVCLALTLVFYSLWAIDFHLFEVGTLNQYIILATIPLVYFIMMRYSLDIEKTSNDGDPIDVLLNDKILVLFSLLFLIMIAVAVYFPITL